MVIDSLPAIHRLFLEQLIYDLPKTRELVTKDTSTSEIQELIKTQKDPRAVANLCMYLWLRQATV